MDLLKQILSAILRLVGRNSQTASQPLLSAPQPRILALDPSNYAERLLAEVNKAGRMPDDFTPEQEYNGAYGYSALLGPDGKVKATYCNFFVRRVASWFGWQEWFHQNDDQASEITSYMRLNPKIWESLAGVFPYTNVKTKEVTPKSGPDYEAAAKYASEGQLVIAGWINPDGGGHGHICIIAPEPPANMLFSNKWGRKVPIAVNVGKDNWYGKSLSWAFAIQEPELFRYKGRPA